MPRPKKPVIYLDSPESLKKARQVFTRNRKMLALTREKISEIVDDIDAKYVTELKDELGRYPLPRDRNEPVDWESDKQRKFMMWMWKKRGLKLPHQRTGDMGRAWDVEVSEAKYGYGISIKVDNKLERSKFVVGLAGFRKDSVSIRKYEKPIQRFHKDRWKPAHKIIRPYVVAIQEEFEKQMNEWYGDMLDLTGMDDLA